MKCKCDFACYACQDREMNKEMPNMNSSQIDPCKFIVIIDVDLIDEDTEDDILDNYNPTVCPYDAYNESRWCLDDYIAY